MSDKKDSNQNDKQEKNSNSCNPELTKEEKELRDGRKSLTIPSGNNAKNKIRYVEGTTPLKDGCWLSDE